MERCKWCLDGGIVQKYHDEEWVQRAIQNEKKHGFIYIEDILESLEEYENQRQIYPTFDLYYPMIVKHLETVKAR